MIKTKSAALRDTTLACKLLKACFILALYLSSANSNALDTTFEHNYISCAQSTVETLTIVQLAQRGLLESDALSELPARRPTKQRIKDIYALINKEGILNTYSFVNSNYARCARLVYEREGIPAKDLASYRYYFCAGENKIRYEILLHTNEKFDLDYVVSNTPDSHLDTAITYFNLAHQQGLLAAFDYTANNLKSCIAP